MGNRNSDIVPQRQDMGLMDEEEQIYPIPVFRGLNQSADEETMDPGESPDAENVVSDGGMLTVAPGVSKLTDERDDSLWNGRLWYQIFAFYGDTKEDSFILLRDVGALYKYAGGTLSHVYDFPTSVAASPFRYLNYQSGTTKYMIIGSGYGQTVKYDGSSTPTPLSSNAPAGFLPFAVYQERLWGLTPSDPNLVYYSDDLNPENWTLAAYGAGLLEVPT